jgi:hypothetical protein
MTSTMVTTIDTPTPPDTVRACLWCEKVLPSRRIGSTGRFCCAAHRTSFWSACRILGERAVALGVVTIADLKADPAACTLRWRGEAPSPRPEIGPTDRPAPEPLTRLVIEVPTAVIDKLVLLHFEIANHEREDALALLAALSRVGRRPVISKTPAGETILSY